jgi:hypothetical protein
MSSHRPNDERRRIVTVMSAGGIPESEIAAALEISDAALAELYSPELAAGSDQANARVVANILRIATGDTPQALAAATFWAKARMGWVEAKASTAAHENAAKMVAQARTAKPPTPPKLVTYKFAQKAR